MKDNRTVLFFSFFLSWDGANRPLLTPLKKTKEVKCFGLSVCMLVGEVIPGLEDAILDPGGGGD